MSDESVSMNFVRVSHKGFKVSIVQHEWYGEIDTQEVMLRNPNGPITGNEPIIHYENLSELIDALQTIKSQIDKESA